MVQSDIDPSRGHLWLDIANGKLAIPQGAENMMSQVLLPFRVGEAAARRQTRGPCSRVSGCFFWTAGASEALPGALPEPRPACSLARSAT